MSLMNSILVRQWKWFWIDQALKRNEWELERLVKLVRTLIHGSFPLVGTRGGWSMSSILRVADMVRENSRRKHSRRR